VAETLIKHFAELSEARPELLAHHLSEAGLFEKAISYWQKAGIQAVARSANVEALTHLEKELELIDKLPAGPERAQQELTALVTLASPLIAIEGHGSTKVGVLCDRIRKLCQQLGDRLELFPALFALVGFSLTRGEFDTATEAGFKLITVAEEIRDSGLFTVGSFALGATLYYRGESVAARSQLERGIATYQSDVHNSLRFQYVFDPGVGCRRVLALVLWVLGHPDRSLRHISEAVAQAKAQQHPYGLAGALLFAAVLHQYRGEPHLVRRHAEAAMAISLEHAFPLWSSWARVLVEWVEVQHSFLAASRADLAGAVSRLNTAVTAFLETGTGMFRPYWMGLLADAHRQADQVDEGLSQATRALAMVERSGERLWEPELHRVRGELLIHASEANAPKAETCFRLAQDIAARQGSKSLSLRASTSLARLLKRQGRADLGRAVLAPAYLGFTEGFSTQDLRVAKVLLQELA
jgi:predicted ATPase